jgi:hypothetical protein
MDLLQNPALKSVTFQGNQLVGQLAPYRADWGVW